MTTPISITKYRLKEIIHAAGLEPCDYEEVFSSIKTGEIVNMARIALAAMDAEPVADVVAWHKEGEERTCDIRLRRFDLAPGPLFAVAQPVATVPDAVEIEIENLKQKLVDCNRYNYCADAVKSVEDACRAAMPNHSENERDMVQPVSLSYKLPSQSSDAVNEAAWKLHDTLTEHGPLNGHQFNNLKECFYEALKVAMCNSPVIPDDVRRMDWLVSKTVDVREPMVYGSHSLFWSQTITDEEDEYHATKLREQIDAAMAAEQAAAPQQEG